MIPLLDIFREGRSEKSNCFHCQRDHFYDDPDHPDPDKGCQILAASFVGPVPEWIHADNGRTICTAFCPENACLISDRPKAPRQVEGQLGMEVINV